MSFFMPLNCSHLNEGAVADLNEIFSERKIQTPEAERWWIPFTSLSFTRTNSPWILMLMLTSAEWLMRFTDANTPAVGSLCMRAGVLRKQMPWNSGFQPFWLIYVQPQQFTTRAAMISQSTILRNLNFFQNPLIILVIFQAQMSNTAS